MKKLQKSFTILELLISLSLSSFIILGMMQAYRNVMRYLEDTNKIMNTNRKICLLFHQLERDFSSAYIPDLYQEKKTKSLTDNKSQDFDEDSDEKLTQNTAEQKEAAKKKAEEKAKLRKSYFIATPDDRADLVKIGDKRYQLFKNITFICSNPLQIYGEKMVRLVRVNYELTVDKQKSKGDTISYKLWRKETADLANVKCVIDENAPPGKAKPVRTYLVADNIKYFFTEYILVKTKKKSELGMASTEKAEKEEKIEERTFAWGNKKEFEGIVPQRIEVRIEFWNDELTATHQFNTVFPIYSFPTIKEKEKKKKDKTPIDNNKNDSKTGAPTSGPKNSSGPQEGQAIQNNPVGIT